MGNFNAVYVNDLESLEGIFKQEAFSDRINYENSPVTEFMKLIRGGNYSKSHSWQLPPVNDNEIPLLDPDFPPGIAASSGEVWKEQRRFALRHLKDFGFGRSSMETFIMDEIQELIQDLKSKIQNESNELNLAQSFNLSVLNGLWKIMTGKRYDINDPAAREKMDEQAKL